MTTASKWSVGLAAVLGAVGGTAFLTATAAPLKSQSSQTATAPEILLNIDSAKSKVHYTVDSTLHTVHGTLRGISNRVTTTSSDLAMSIRSA